MNYFQNFPTIQHQVESNSNAKIILSDIMRKIEIKDSVSNNATQFYTYTISDGDKADDVARKVYGSPNYFWVVLLLNNIVNPYHDWNLSTTEFEKFLDAKYPGYMLQFTPDTLVLNLESSNGVFTTGATITQANTTANATVLHHDTSNNTVYINNIELNSSELNTINLISETSTVNATISSISTQGCFSVNILSPSYVQQDGGANGKVIAYDTDNQQCMVTLQTNKHFESDSTKPIYEYRANATGKFLATGRSATIRSDYIGYPAVLLSKEGIHHYVNKYDDIVPRNYTQIIKNTSDGQSYDYSTSETRTVDGAGPVTNREYEDAENELKREIVLLKPELLDIFVKEFKERIKS